jgi:hypothetical protein
MAVLRELGVVEQRYQAVLLVIGEGVAVRRWPPVLG